MAPGFGQMVELVLGREVGVDDLSLSRDAAGDIGKPVVILRADDEIHFRRAPDDFLAFRLGDASRDAYGDLPGLRPLFQGAQPSE